MKCHYCGSEILDTDKFCIFCGTKVEIPQEEAEAFDKWASLSDVAEPIVPIENIETAYPASQQTEEVLPVPAAVWDLEEKTVAVAVKPALQLPGTRALWKMVVFGILTAGIYPFVIWNKLVTELNIAASRYDGKRTMPWLAMLVLAPITLGIYPLVWYHGFCSRIGEELKRRKLDMNFGPGTFWLWGILGSLILVGPLVFVHKLLKAMNRINNDFNTAG
jgi:hypothetical protein